MRFIPKQQTAWSKLYPSDFMRSDNIGFEQGDYPVVSNISERFAENPIDQVQGVLMQKFQSNFPQIYDFLFGGANNPYLSYGMADKIGGAKGPKGRPKIYKGKQATTSNPASFRGSGGFEDLLLKENGFDKKGNSPSYNKFVERYKRGEVEQPKANTIDTSRLPNESDIDWLQRIKNQFKQSTTNLQEQSPQTARKPGRPRVKEPVPKRFYGTKSVAYPTTVEELPSYNKWYTNINSLVDKYLLDLEPFLQKSNPYYKKALQFQKDIETKRAGWRKPPTKMQLIQDILKK